MNPTRFWAVAIGCSAGGLKALQSIVPTLRPDLSTPVIVVCHTGSGDIDQLCELIGRGALLPVREARERMPAAPGAVYVASADYHLLLEPELRFALSTEMRVAYSRPSIDVLFESVADVCGPRAIGVVLTGSNHDGAAGLKHIREAGGVGIVQRPDSAEASAMPAAALALAGADHCLTLAEIGPLLNNLCAP